MIQLEERLFSDDTLEGQLYQRLCDAVGGALDDFQTVRFATFVATIASIGGQLVARVDNPAHRAEMHRIFLLNFENAIMQVLANNRMAGNA